jgi:hypothetical protein
VVVVMGRAHIENIKSVLSSFKSYTLVRQYEGLDKCVVIKHKNPHDIFYRKKPVEGEELNNDDHVHIIEDEEKNCGEMTYREVRNLCKILRQSTRDINLKSDKKTLCKWLMNNKTKFHFSCNEYNYQEVRNHIKTMRKNTEEINLKQSKKKLCDWLTNKYITKTSI